MTSPAAILLMTSLGNFFIIWAIMRQSGSAFIMGVLGAGWERGGVVGSIRVHL